MTGRRPKPALDDEASKFEIIGHEIGIVRSRVFAKPARVFHRRVGSQSTVRSGCCGLLCIEGIIQKDMSSSKGTR
jgi:hypothetical protein